MNDKMTFRVADILAKGITLTEVEKFVKKEFKAQLTSEQWKKAKIKASCDDEFVYYKLSL